MKKYDIIIIRVYNTGFMDVEINTEKTIFSKKSELDGWLLFAKSKGLSQQFFERKKNGDRIYYFS